jgi:hypothetical protein
VVCFVEGTSLTCPSQISRVPTAGPYTLCRAGPHWNLTLHPIAALPYSTAHSAASRCLKRSAAAAMKTIAGQVNGQHAVLASNATHPASHLVRTPITWYGKASPINLLLERASHLTNASTLPSEYKFTSQLRRSIDLAHPIQKRPTSHRSF